MEAWNCNFDLIDPRVIVVDHRYQRPEKPALIAAIAANPTWAVFGVLICSKRTNHMHYCLDGQQRLKGVLSCDKPPMQVPVVWIPVATSAEEANLFSIINENRKSMQSLEKYVSHLHGKDPTFLQIDSALTRAGFTAGNAPSDSRTIGAVSALQYVHNLVGEDGLWMILRSIQDAWPNDRKALETTILKALGDVVAERNGSLDHKRLTAALSKTSPATALRRAEGLKFDMGGSKKQNVRRAFKELAKL